MQLHFNLELVIKALQVPWLKQSNFIFKLKIDLTLLIILANRS